jgi:Vanadium chloroperoxidase N-terminal domain/PAP2 superfamily
LHSIQQNRHQQQLEFRSTEATGTLKLQLAATNLSNFFLRIAQRIGICKKPHLNLPRRSIMDPILYWNDVALEANRVSHTNGKNEQTGPTLSSRALAIVHLAMYDAYAAVRGNPLSPVNLSSYLPGLPNPDPNASADAAVAAAAHATLSSLFPSQKPFFDLKHTQAGLQGNGLQEGHEFGLLVAQRLLEKRQGDPSASDDGYAASMARGAHRPDPDNAGQGFHAPFYGAKSRCFAVTDRHELDAPPQPGTPEYLDALRQVRGKGIAPELMGTLPAGISARTANQTLVGVYWGYDGAAELGTPPRLYNQIVRTVALHRNNSVDQNARLFALVNASMGDAGVLAWDQKYVHDLWRPVLGIRESDPSLGPAATSNHTLSEDSDPSWLPLGAPKSNSKTMEKNFTPPFPAYPSGHATFGAAALHITRLFYGVNSRSNDNLFDGLSFVSDEFNGINRDNQGAIRPKHVRSFPGGLWEMIVENGLSRVYLGVHWVFDAFAADGAGQPNLSRNIGGVPLGLTIAEDIFNNGLNLSNVGPRS